MALVDLIKHGVSGNAATATPATPATDRLETTPSVATVATVAVATTPTTPAKQATYTQYEKQLADEAERRADFCNIHRAMLGTCEHFNVIERLGNSAANSTITTDQAAALDACLLWRLIRTGRNIEQAAQAEIVGGVTVGDVLAWVSVNAKDVEAIRKDRRLLLTCAESLQGAGHFWETLH